MEASRLTAMGGVLMAAAVTLSEIRLESSWSRTVHFAVAGVAFLVLFALALRMPNEEGGRPTAEQSALFAAGLVVLVIAVFRFGNVATNNDEGHSGTVTWLALVYAAIALYPALRRGSAVCALAAAAALGVAAIEFLDWVWPGTTHANGVRWMFFGLMLAYALGTFVLRHGRTRYAAQLVNAAMLPVLGIMGTVELAQLGADEGDTPTPMLSTWWELVVIAGSLAAVAFAIRSRERGPGWSGSSVLLIALIVIGSESGKRSFVGWPLTLTILAALTLAAGFVSARRT